MQPFSSYIDIKTMKKVLVVLLSILIICSCKTSKEITPSNLVVTEKMQSKDEIEYDRFLSKIKRLKSSLKTHDYSSANSIMRMLEYDMKREIGQTKALLSTEVEEREALESIFKKQQLMARQLSRFTFKKGDPFQKITAAVNQLNKFADTMKP